jgi:hypothetical protein
MSSRPLLQPYHLVVAHSMTSSFNSAPTNIQQLSQIGYDIAWTGTPTGTFSVQVSNSYTQDSNGVVENPGNWTTLTLSSAVTASGSAGNAYIDIDQLSATWMRLVYTAASGTGSLDAYVAGKVA